MFVYKWNPTLNPKQMKNSLWNVFCLSVNGEDEDTSWVTEITLDGNSILLSNPGSQAEIGFSWISAQALVVKLNETVSSLGVHLLYTNLGRQRLCVCSCGDYSSFKRQEQRKAWGRKLSWDVILFFCYCKSKQGKCSPDMLGREREPLTATSVNGGRSHIHGISNNLWDPLVNRRLRVISTGHKGATLLQHKHE